MNIQKTAWLLICICVSTLSQAQVKKTPTKSLPAAKPKPAAAIKGDNSLLFEITGNGVTQPSWLFGTMHVLCAEDAVVSAGLKKVIRNSEKIFFEVNMSDMGALMNALQFMRMSDNVKLSDLLTPVEYDRVKKYFDTNSAPIPFAMMNRFKPFFVSALIGENLLDCKQKTGMEEVIMAEANQANKKIDGLETMQFQASLFDSVPYEKQAKDLMTYIDSSGQYREEMEETVRQYRQQNIRGLDSLMQKNDPGMTEYLDLLLYQRNHRWYDQIAEQIHQQPTLFAVGAGHLGGEKGVINLLRQHGYTIKAIAN